LFLHSKEPAPLLPLLTLHDLFDVMPGCVHIAQYAAFPARTCLGSAIYKVAAWSDTPSSHLFAPCRSTMRRTFVTRMRVPSNCSSTRRRWGTPASIAGCSRDALNVSALQITLANARAQEQVIASRRAATHRPSSSRAMSFDRRYGSKQPDARARACPCYADAAQPADCRQPP
jgi:hypothetical protein